MVKTRIFWSVISLLFFCFVSCTRNKSEDSCINTQKETSLLDSIKRLDSISDVYWIRNDSLSILYAKKALKLALTFPSGEQLIKTYNVLGKAFYRHYKDSSYYYHNQGLLLANRLNSIKEKPSLFFNIAELYHYAGNLKDALTLFDSSIIYSLKTSNYKVLADGYNSMGIVYLEVNDTVHALRYIKMSLQVGEKYSLSHQKGVANANLALFEKEYNKKISFQKQAILFLKKSPGTGAEIADINVNIGSVENNSDSAMVYYNKVLVESKSEILPETEIGAYNNLAYCYLEKGNINNSINCLVEKAIPLAIKVNNLDWLSTLYDSYSEMLSAKGATNEALVALHKSIMYHDQFNEKKNERQVRLLAAIFDLNNKETTIKEKETVIRNEHLQNRFLKLIIALALLIIIIIVILYIGYRQSTKLKFKQQQVTSAKKIIEIEEKEKSRIGFELHDNLGYLLQITDGFIQSMKIEDTTIKEQLNEKMQELSESVRRISHRISLIKDEKSTLQELIPDIINDMKKFTGINVDYFIPEQFPQLPKEVNVHICRIIQELITNASKFAKDSKIQIFLTFVGKNLHLYYKDDGIGFDPSHIGNNGIGIGSIYERVSLLEGKVLLVSSPGNGTHWEISIPVS